MTDALALLEAWMPRQRWFPATGIPPRLRLLADLPLGEDPRVRILIVADEAQPHPPTLQVPLVRRPDAPGLREDPHVIGVTGAGEALVDGPHDPLFTDALLRAVAPRLAGATGRAAIPAEVLRGEQSNTSIVYRPEDSRPEDSRPEDSRPEESPSGGAAPVVCKVFRRLHHGTNPDIELQSALSAAGSRHVPATVGVLEASWPDVRDHTRLASGALAFAQEFLPGVEDAWRVALHAATAGDDFASAGASLGRATAQVHAELARLFGTRAPDAAARTSLTDAWARRLEAAAAAVPALRPCEAEIAERYAAAAAAPWPDLQRIHGDLHLGQVLQVPGRDWVLIDFEGEPLRPMAQRLSPDLALRDVAGMLRSFDYVAGAVAGDDPARAHAAADWAGGARRAFLDGYAEVAGPGGAATRSALRDALELDKAVYEAEYEARHRPGWLAIPLAAITRLLAS